MKLYGQIIQYDGYTGEIITSNEERYLLLSKEIMDEEILKEGDYVTFRGELYETPDLSMPVARFVKKVNNNE